MNGTVIRYSSNESAIRVVDSVYRVQENETARLSVPVLSSPPLLLVFFFFFFPTNDLHFEKYIELGLNNGPRSRALCASMCAIYRTKFFIDDNKLRVRRRIIVFYLSSK